MKRAVLLAALLAIPASLHAQSQWYEFPEQGFKISVPSSYQTAEFVDGTDDVRAFLSPDENVGLRIRTVPVSGVSIDQVIPLFEGHVLPNSERLVLQPYDLNGVSGQMAGYRWTYNGIQVIVAAFYTMRSDRFHAAWYLVPENMFQARTAEGDAILNSFTLMSAAAETPQGGGLGALMGNPSAGQPTTPPGTNPPSAGGGLTSIGGRTNPPPQQPPTQQPPSQTMPPPPSQATNPPTGAVPSVGGGSTSVRQGSGSAPAGYTMLVEETARMEFPIPDNYSLVDQSQGQMIYEGSGEDDGVRLVIQTVDWASAGYTRLEDIKNDLQGQVSGNADADEVEQFWPIADSGLEMLAYVFDLKEGSSGRRFVYTVLPTRQYATFVSFVAPWPIMFRAEIHAREVRTHARVVGGGEDRIDGLQR